MADRCHYEVHVKKIKEEMVCHIKSLEQQNAELQGSVREKVQWVELIVQALMQDERDAEAIERLKRGRSYEQLVNWLGRPPFEDIAQLLPVSKRLLLNVMKKYESAMILNGVPDGGAPTRWTTVISNDAILHHLMALYFTWIHPVHMLFSEKHFMESFRNEDHTYCTPVLVNVMCAMGCFLLVDEGGDEKDAKRLGARFLEQVYRNIATEDQKKPTFATTYAMLFLVELSAGQARKAASHLRLAVESLHKADTSGFAPEAFEIVSWGIHAMNTYVSSVIQAH